VVASTERTGMAKAGVFQFIREVRQEAAKVTWPSRQEVIITTVMVLLMVAATALFFFFVDTILKWLVDTFIYNI
jgi:preprotein translocase subunit SecE